MKETLYFVMALLAFSLYWPLLLLLFVIGLGDTACEILDGIFAPYLDERMKYLQWDDERQADE